MQLGMVGLGRMGMNMVQRLIKAGHQCVGFDSNQARATCAGVTTRSAATSATASTTSKSVGWS